jgi:ribosomal protein S18 acetylase RimI-like enzyme
MEITTRRLGPGDEPVVAAFAESEPRTALLHDEATIFLAAFLGDEPVGFVLAYELPRRHGAASIICVYEVDVAEKAQRRGIATRLLNELADIARERGIGEGFVLTEPDNVAANRLYESVGGVSSQVVMWDFGYAGS